MSISQVQDKYITLQDSLYLFFICLARSADDVMLIAGSEFTIGFWPVTAIVESDSILVRSEMFVKSSTLSSTMTDPKFESCIMSLGDDWEGELITSCADSDEW